MNRISLFDTAAISVWAYPDRSMIHHMMRAYCYGDDFRTALSRGADALEEYQATKWLSDDRTNGALLPEDREWAVTVWFPRVLVAGWKHWAVVQPAKVIGQVSMARFIKQYGEAGINARMFADAEEAMRWLDAA